MYEVHIYFNSLDDRLLKFGKLSNKPFYFRSASEVCDLIQVLPPRAHINLLEFDFDSVDDVKKFLENGSEDL